MKLTKQGVRDLNDIFTMKLAERDRGQDDDSYSLSNSVHVRKGNYWMSVPGHGEGQEGH